MRTVLRLLFESVGDHALDVLIGDGSRRPRPRRVEESVEPHLDEAFAPPAAATPLLWDEEYQRNIKEEPMWPTRWWRKDDRSAATVALDGLKFSEEAMEAIRELDEEPWMSALEELERQELEEVADAE